MPDLISSIVPDPSVLLSLEPAELAGVLLQYLNSLPENERKLFNRYNLFLPNSALVAGYRAEHHDRIRDALMEGWSWLEREGLIALKPGHQGEWYFVTRRGQQLAKATDLQAYRKANLLPKELLHPVIAQKVWSLFIRGDYDTAVFQAFKEVEVAVRKAGSFPDTLIGLELMRRAFAAGAGPLADADVPTAEQEATAHLFAGAIGLLKNPGSHRHVGITDPTEAVELLCLASWFLRVVDRRTTTAAGPAAQAAIS